jgi:hypothetical protein
LKAIGCGMKSNGTLALFVFNALRKTRVFCTHFVNIGTELQETLIPKVNRACVGTREITHEKSGKLLVLSAFLIAVRCISKRLCRAFVSQLQCFFEVTAACLFLFQHNVRQSPVEIRFGILWIYLDSAVEIG